MIGFGSFKILKLQKEREHYKYLQPKKIKQRGLEKDIVKVVDKKGGIIVGSYALKHYNPQVQPHDIDILASNKHILANAIVSKLNRKYGKRFELHRSINAVRIFDKKTYKYIADVAAYPIKQMDTVKVNHLTVATPQFVYKGKIKQIKTRLFRL